MKLLGSINSAAVTRDWLNAAYESLFPDRASCIGGIEFPLDVHYERMVPFIVDGLKTGNLKVSGQTAMLVEGMQDRAIWPEMPLQTLRQFGPMRQ